jgi:ankyrin repeat protein
MSRPYRYLLAMFCSAVLCATMQAGGDLTWAAGTGKLEKAKKFLAEGADINELDKNGWTPLMWSIHNRQPQLTGFLLEKGANPDLQSTQPKAKMAKGFTALHIACYLGNGEALTSLLAAKAKLDPIDAAGMTPLHIAAWTGHQDALIQLFRAGARADLADAMGKKAVTYAVEEGLFYGTGLLWKASKLNPGHPCFEPGMNCLPLGKSYTKIVLIAQNSPQRSSKKDLEVAKECEASALGLLKESKVFESVALKSDGIAEDATTLLVSIEIQDYLIVGAARDHFGPLAGASWMTAKVKFLEPGTEKVLREQLINTQNGVWAAAGTYGATDRAIPAEMGAIICAYAMIVAKP